MSTSVRLIQLDDARALVDLLMSDRRILERWVPARPMAYYTIQGQRTEITRQLTDLEAGRAFPCVVLDGARIIGRVALTSIQREGMQSAVLGYWLSQDETGRGHATRAVNQICAIAYDGLKLHRIEAGAVVTNLASRRVLQRNEFAGIGVARRYVLISGQWCDAMLFQRLARD